MSREPERKPEPERRPASSPAPERDLIQFDAVSLKYRLGTQRQPSFKEHAMQWLRGALAYEDFWALTDVSLRIRRGESVGIIGRNGAGKSTLLKVILGVLEPTTGSVQVNGQVVPVLDLGAGLDWELTGLENIYFNALLLGRTRAEVHAVREAIVDNSGLGSFIMSPLRNYSAGMVARLAFSVATAWTPEILILDEVLSVGDAGFVEHCTQQVQRFRESGSTILVVSHRDDEIRSSCDRCIWMDNGTIRADGPTERVLDEYLHFTAAQQSIQMRA
jgi:ABC-2 type transport system ATP-binding protein/lipopolysaccharide transport system ATP-binding protein